MKKTYIKPTIQVVKLQQRSHILAGSPNGYDSQSLDIPGGQIDNEGDVF